MGIDLTPTNPETAACCGGGGSCEPDGLSRRSFIALSALGAAGAGAALGLWPTSADATVNTRAVPATSHFDRRWLDGLAARGTATEYTGRALRRVGMPVGGACTGQVYLSGDGRTWLWDVFNADSFRWGGDDWQGLHYAGPVDFDPVFTTGFALRWSDGGAATTRTLDGDGFGDVRFRGRYPIGHVELRDDGCPLEVDLDAFSPFVPTNVADSSLPATVFEYTLRNRSDRTVSAQLLGVAENPVCLDSRHTQPILLTTGPLDEARAAGFVHSAATYDGPQPERPDIVFEDWERETYAPWTATGTAFGPGPVAVDELPGYMLRGGGLGVSGRRFVSTHHFRDGDDIVEADTHTGRLTSPPFTVERSSIVVRVGGGDHAGATCLNVLVDGAVVASADGANEELLRTYWLDVSAHQGRAATIEILDTATGGWGHVNVDRILFTDRPAPRPDVVLEDWERTTYAPWTATGTAFGSGPVTEAEAPAYFRREGPLNVNGQRFVTSHNWRDGGPPADDHKGTLTSAPFAIERRYLAAYIAGGNRVDAGLKVVVDGEVVARLTGHNSEVMRAKAIDVSAYEGRTAVIELHDEGVGGWAHVNCDRIWLSDVPINERPLDELPDAGTFGLAVFGRPDATVRPSIADWSGPDAWFDSADGPLQIDGGSGTLAGTVTVPVTLAPGEEQTVRYALTWHFPKIGTRFGYIAGAAALRRHYAETYADAAAVVTDLAERGDDLASATHTFATTWYDDATLPVWFLERTLIPASTVATGTCLRFHNGRFYAWEGIYCCDGTCTHVWNYAQSVGRLFPELERDARERVDYGIAFHEDTGAMDYRGEAHRRVAHDGQCGTILRTYREHQMSADGAFLGRIWPQVKKATEYLIDHDGSGDGGSPDGVLEAEQYNTLDASWYGEIPWITGLYVAALRAAAEMAVDVGDSAFADRCRSLADAGSAHLDGTLWNDTYGYYEHVVDPAHADATNSNRGCHIDQLFGQTYAHQLGLPRVFERQHTLTALTNLVRNNHLPDAQAYQDESGIVGGRTYSTEGEAGTVMCTWPFGGADSAPGDGDPGLVAYFNEVWTGQEYQLAALLLAEGMADEALAVIRAVHDRYSAEKRNPYNEIECSDHYARAMMSHAVYLAATGYEYHGPRGHLGFAPRLGDPSDVAAAFTVAEGWGLYRQRRTGDRQRSEVELRYGRLRVRTFATAVPERPGRRQVVAELVTDRRRRRLDVAGVSADGGRVLVTLAGDVELTTADTLVVTVA
ncbi:twin-arginine translocation signal domain-containing protein [Jiangella aurantiaca]|uniref:Twin-arginine translocation signal domain-containing protein n=1 Tax=Jiangella aurantiaca TaxID=2530373 RepID=A0A4R5A5G3_9ACTN|nr:GH116 family glycosyl-hydrolase [Jiangella aurantiaca]TDD66270.1 twin-arginine translocation signal domain-containing protein [Jiangella aurantiaca]